MMLPLVIGLLDRIPAEKLKTTAPFAVLGVAYSASIGGRGTLVGSDVYKRQEGACAG